MPVEEESSIRTTSESDIAEQKKIADEIKQASEDLKKTSDDLAKGVSPISSPGNQNQPTLPKGRERGQDRRTAISGNRNDFKKLQDDVKKREKQVKNLEKQLKEQKEKTKAIESRLTNLSEGILDDPKSLIQSEILDIFSKAGPPGIAVGIAAEVYRQIQKQFEPGGLWDIRVLVRDEVRAMGGLENIIEIDNGNVFFTAETDLTRTPPETSNTARLRDGHLRHNQVNLGE